MKLSKLLTLIVIFSFLTGLYPASAVPGYVPHQSDHFSYYETADVGSGTGSYDGYTDHTVVNGMETMDQVFGNGTVSATYSFSWTFNDNSGTLKTGGSSGNFTWSSLTFLYVRGTDNQTGYVNPTVWFYSDNSSQTGATFYLLNTPMTIKSRNYGFFLPSQNRTVNTIFAQGSSSYQRNDAYGQFNSEYTWSVYFDPSTGYIIGYRWDEHDTSGFAGFTYTENLYVTSTSYPLAAGTQPSSPLFQYLVTILAVALIIAIVMIVLVVVFSRRRRSLPKHAYQQEYRPPPPSGPPPPSIDLTPKQPPVQQIVIKEVVKVKCKYCGALIDSTVQFCPLCGAPRT